jgi:hypothetical protein
VNRIPLAGEGRHEVAPHHVAGCRVKLAKPLVIQLGRVHPRIDAKRPERLAFIDVADTGAYPLLKE